MTSSPSASPRRYTRHSWYVWRWVLLVLLVCLLRWWWGSADAPSVVREGDYKVSHVIDGDTLVLQGGAILRLQGIDTPETVHPDLPVQPWGPEATAYTRGFVADAGGQVRITLSSERLDRYGRHLGYVWHEDRLLNEELVYHGLAETRPRYPQSATIKRRLQKALDDARRSQRGLWSESIASSPQGDSLSEVLPSS
jgi:micrococcal nuclease